MSKFEDYEIIKKLFGGAMGKTFLVKLKKTGVEYVMKRIDYLDEQDKKRADEEVEQMKKLESRFTVKLICVFPDRMDLCLILEYCKNGDLRKVIGELQKLPIEERINKVWNLFSQITQALDFMHSNQVVHRDIKPENIFLMEDGTIRLGDFGLAKELTLKYYATIAGTKFYLAAEVYLQNRMTYMSDMFAFGVVLFELLTGQHPFQSSNEQATIDKIKNGQHSDLPNWVPQEMKTAIIKMINTDSLKRPTTKDLMKIESINNLILKLDDEQFIRELNIDKLKQMKEELKSINKSNKSSNLEIQTLISESMKAVIYIRSEKIPRVSNEMIKQQSEIIESCAIIVHQTKENKKYFEDALLSGFFIELIELIKCKPINQIKQEWVEILLLACKNGSSEQTHQMYEVGIFQILSPSLKMNDNIKIDLIEIFINVVKKGWKQVNLNLTSSSSSQCSIQQIISLHHPYAEQLEQQGIIKSVIEDIAMNEKITIIINEKAWNFLNIIYPIGIQLPPDIKLQVIKQFCQYARSESKYTREYAFKSLSILAINQDNHQMIIDGKIMDDAIELTIDEVQKKVKYVYNDKIDLLFFLHLFIFGTQQTQQLIQNKLTKKILEEIQNINYYNNSYYFAEQLLCAYSDPQGIKYIVLIKRIVEIRNEEGLIDLINFGLIQLLNEIIEKLINEDENGEGKMIIIEEIIKLLIKNNSEISRIIIEETDFIEQQLLLLSQIPTDKINEWHLSPLYKLIINLSYQFEIEQKQKFFQKGIIQFMMNLEAQSRNVDCKKIIIILSIIKNGAQELKEGQLHPYYQQLQSDGTIPKLIEILKDENESDLHQEIAQILAYLFKSLPLPHDIRNKVIDELKYLDDFNGFSPLAECPDNHNTILDNVFKTELFLNDEYTLEYLNLSLNILKFGSNENKQKVINDAKKKVEKLSNDKYVDNLGNQNNWDKDKQQQIKSKVKEIDSIIKGKSDEQYNFKEKKCTIQ